MSISAGAGENFEVFCVLCDVAVVITSRPTGKECMQPMSIYG